MPGLDQINVLLPRSPFGSAQVNISISVNGKASNEVSVFLR
jgi:uncharacterized protein (TIGR03437 family)